MDKKVFIRKMMEFFVVADDFAQSKMITRLLLLKEDNSAIGTIEDNSIKE